MLYTHIAAEYYDAQDQSKCGAFRGSWSYLYKNIWPAISIWDYNTILE